MKYQYKLACVTYDMASSEQPSGSGGGGTARSNKTDKLTASTLSNKVPQEGRKSYMVKRKLAAIAKHSRT